MNDEYFMSIALKEACACRKHGDVPIGAVIVCNNEIVSKGRNLKEKKKRILAHAEIVAISRANKKRKSYRLDDCVIYITKEPCLMCMGAILSSRIKKIIYGASDPRFGTKELAKTNNFNHKCEIEGGVLADDCEALLSDFFKCLRGCNESSRKAKNKS